MDSVHCTIYQKSKFIHKTIVHESSISLHHINDDHCTHAQPSGALASTLYTHAYQQSLIFYEKYNANYFRDSTCPRQSFLHVKTVNATNSDTFIEFLEELRHKYTKILFILDNASYHKSKMVREYQGSITGGNVKMLFLSQYTPQLNPIEIQWRMIKTRIAGRYFGSREELNSALIHLVESGEVPRVHIRNFPIA